MKTVISLTEAFSSPGVFWEPKKQVPFSATISYEPENGLALIAATTTLEFDQLFSFAHDEIPLLAGVLTDGTRCDLFNILMVKSSTVWTDWGIPLGSPRFVIKYALFGDAAEQEQPPHVDALHIHFDELDDICGLPTIPHSDNAGRVTIEFPAYDEPVLSVAIQESTFKFQYHRRVTVSGSGYAEGSYTSVASFVFQSPKSLEEMDSFMSRAAGFVSLLSDVHSAPRVVTVTRTSQPEKDHPKSGFLLFHYVHDFPTRKPKFESVVRIRLLGKKAETVARNWFESEEEPRRVFNLYLSTVYAERWIEAQFLSLAQAIESFHRVFYQYRDMPPSLFDQLKSALRKALETVPLREDVRERVSEGFEFLNDPSLQTRIDVLLQSLSHQAREKLVGDPASFTRALKQTRNYLTHPGIKKKASVLDKPIDWLKFNSRLQALLRLLILRQLGAEEVAILPSVVSGVFR